MYQFRISTDAENQFANLAQRAAIPGVQNAIDEIAKNPYTYKKLKKTGKKVLGEYYIDVNYYAVTLNIDDAQQTVDIITIIPNAYLYRLMKL